MVIKLRSFYMSEQPGRRLFASLARLGVATVMTILTMTTLRADPPQGLSEVRQFVESGALDRAHTLLHGLPPEAMDDPEFHRLVSHLALATQRPDLLALSRFAITNFFPVGTPGVEDPAADAFLESRAAVSRARAVDLWAQNDILGSTRFAFHAVLVHGSVLASMDPALIREIMRHVESEDPEGRVAPPFGSCIERALVAYRLGREDLARRLVSGIDRGHATPQDLWFVDRFLVRMEAFEEIRRHARAGQAQEAEAQRVQDERDRSVEDRSRRAELVRREARDSIAAQFAHERQRNQLEEQIQELDEKIAELRSVGNYQAYVQPDGSVTLLPTDLMRVWGERRALEKERNARQLQLYNLK